MVRVFSLRAIAPNGLPVARPCLCAAHAVSRLFLLGTLTVCAGCAIVPRAQMDECQQLTRTLRSENARLRDRALALQSQNRDYADRAVDDSRRLTVQEEAIERLEQSVQAYQDERARLESAYKQLASSLSATGLRTSEAGAQSGSPGRQREGSIPPASARRPAGKQAGADDEARR
jgi:hypothetical protein